MKRKGCEHCEELVQTIQSQVMTTESRSVTEKRDGMKQNVTKRSSSDEDDLTPLWSTGPIRFFLF